MHALLLAQVTVIHVEHVRDFVISPGKVLQGNPAVFGSMHGGGGDLRDIWFEDIVVEGPVHRGFGITVQPNPFSSQRNTLGTISNLTFKGVTFLDEQPLAHPSELFGTGPSKQHDNTGHVHSHKQHGHGHSHKQHGHVHSHVELHDDTGETKTARSDQRASPDDNARATLQQELRDGASHHVAPAQTTVIPPGYIGEVFFDGLRIKGTHVMDSNAAVLDVKLGTVEQCVFT
jgi:hypothetical protein